MPKRNQEGNDSSSKGPKGDPQKEEKQNQKYAPVEAREAGHLASFVAAVLKDRSVDDLVEETKRLQKKLDDQLDDQLLLQIMGLDGIVYYQTSMKTGYFVDDMFYVDLPPRRDDHGRRMALPDATPFNVRVGGIILANASSGYIAADMIIVNEHAQFLCLEVIYTSCPEFGRKEFLGLVFNPDKMPGVMALLEDTVKADIRPSMKWQVNDEGDFVEYTHRDRFQTVCLDPENGIRFLVRNNLGSIIF